MNRQSRFNKSGHLLVCQQNKEGWEHRHLKNIDCLSHLVCFISTVNGYSDKKEKKRKEEAYPWKAGASSRHITNLKQSILETFNIYGWESSFLNLQFVMSQLYETKIL